MKNNILILAYASIFFFSCNKDIVQESIKPNEAIEFKVISGAEKAQMLSNMEKDPIFLDYIKSVVDIEKYHKSMVEKNPNFNYKKGKKSSNPKTENELITSMKASGYSDPEGLIKMTKESQKRLIEVYKKYPSFTKSLDREEKKEFFTKVINKIAK